MKNILILTLLILLVFDSDHLFGQLQNGEQAPDFTLTDVDGNSVSLSDYANQIVVLNFLGYNCPFCKDSAPHVETKIWDAFKTSSVQVIGIDTWEGSVNQIKSLYINPTMVSYPILTQGQNVSTQYKTSYDSFYVLDKNHKVYFFRRGSLWTGGSGSSIAQSVADKVQELLIITDVDEEEAPLPLDFHLEQNYPNPFNPETTIAFQLSATQNISLSIYNVLGQKIKVLVNDIMPPGNHNIRWDGRDENGAPVSSGLYLYRLETKTSVKTKRMTLIK